MQHSENAEEVALNMADHIAAKGKRFHDVQAPFSHRLDTSLRVFDLILTMLKVGLMLWAAMPQAG